MRPTTTANKTTQKKTTATETATSTKAATTTTPESKTLEDEFIEAPFREFSKLADIELAIEDNKRQNDNIEIFDDRRTGLPGQKRKKLPRPIEDPPEAVKGQLLRFWKNEPDHHHHHNHQEKNKEDIVEDFTSNSSDDQSKQVAELNLEKEFELPDSLMSNMLELLQSGDITKEDLIETLINTGFLPVEVTKLGKIPIVVGVGGEDQETRLQPTEAPRARLRQRQRQREKLSPERLIELKNPKRPFVDRRPGPRPSTFKDVDSSDPDFEFEQFSVSTPGFVDYEDFGSRKNNPTSFSAPLMVGREQSTVSSSPEKEMKTFDNIEEVMDIMEMLEDGEISEDDFVHMMKNVNQISDNVDRHTEEPQDFMKMTIGRKDKKSYSPTTLSTNQEFDEIRKNIDDISDNLDKDETRFKSSSYSNMKFGPSRPPPRNPELPDSPVRNNPKPFMVFATDTPVNRDDHKQRIH